MTKQERIREIATKSVATFAADIFCKIPKKNEPITPELCAEIMADTERLQAALELTQYGEIQDTGNIGLIKCGGLLWFSENVEPDGEKYYTFDEASNFYTPTKEELESFIERTYYSFDKRRGVGIFADLETGVTLELPANGWRDDDGTLLDAGTYGYYWSATQLNDSLAYILTFNSINASVGNSAKSKRLSARQVISY